MRKILLALLACAISVGVFAPCADAQGGSALIPNLRVKQLKWKDWNDPALAMSDTTFIGGAAHATEDTTEAISTADWSWGGAGSGAVGSTNIWIGKVGAVATGYVDSNIDTVYACVEQSMDGITWSKALLTGIASTSAAWDAKTVHPAASFVASANNAPFVVLDASLVTTEASTGAMVTTAAASGVYRLAPFLRFRVRCSAGANDKISGLKFFVAYCQR